MSVLIQSNVSNQTNVSNQNNLFSILPELVTKSEANLDSMAKSILEEMAGNAHFFYKKIGNSNGTGIRSPKLLLQGIVKFTAIQKVQKDDFLIETESYASGISEIKVVNPSTGHNPNAAPFLIGEGIIDMVSMELLRIPKEDLPRLKEGSVLCKYDYIAVVIRSHSSDVKKINIKNTYLDPEMGNNCSCSENSHLIEENPRECGFERSQIDGLIKQITQDRELEIVDKVNIIQRVILKNDNLILQKGTKNHSGDEYFCDLGSVSVDELVI